MDFGDLLIDAFDRIRDVTHRTVGGLDVDALAFRPTGEGNSIAWLVWHLTRIQDDHIADLMGDAQVWTADGWNDRFGLPFAASATGYGQSSAEVEAVRVGSGLLTGYHDAVHARTVRYVRGLDAGDLDTIVDESWEPPVTLAVRLVSIVSDDLQHAGQAAYVRGLAEHA